MNEELITNTAQQEMSDQINELALALAKAQGALHGAVKGSENPFFKSSYADLAAVMEACREPLSANGLSYVQLPGNNGREVTVTTFLLHSSGQWMRSTVGAAPLKTDAQALGSVITYLRRYALSAIVGIAQVDDDGNAASKGKQSPPRISADQALSLQALIDENGIDSAKVHAFMKRSLKVSTFSELTEDGYKHVLSKVEASIKKAAQAASA